MTAMPNPIALKLGVPHPGTLNALTLGEAAVSWAEHGWHAFPIVPRGKTPYAAGEFCGIAAEHPCGFHCATSDTGALADWWRKHPDSNVGITHPETVTIDEDRLGALTDQKVVLPKCPWEITGRAGGGRHFFFRAPAEWPGLDGANVKVTYRMPSVEVKGFGKGYIVAAPSIHASGTRYELKSGGYVPEIPLSVLDRLVEVTRVHVTSETTITILPGGFTLPDAVAEGSRYAAIRSYVAHLYNRGFSEPEMWTMVQTQLAPRFSPALSAPELRERFTNSTKGMSARLGERRGGGDQHAPAAALEDAPLTEFDSRPVEWLWHGWLPRGVVTIMDGNPGVSKSTLVADLVSRITRGLDWPDGSPGLGHPGRAMWITTEDDPGRVLRPRIEAAGGDPALVRFVTSEVVFPDAKDTFRELLVSRASEPLGLALVILDPLFSHIAASVKSIADADMRANVMRPLSDAAEAADVCVLVVRHFSKDTAASSLNRGAGSLGGIVGAARSLWTAVVDPDDEQGDIKIVGVSKSNYARIRPAWRYRVDECTPPGWVTGTVPVISWIGETHETVDTILTAGPDVSDGAHALEEILSDGPLAARAAEARMRAKGFGRAATKGAKRRLRVASTKVGMEEGWMWALPKGTKGLDETPSTPSTPSALAGARAGRDSVSTSSTSSKGSKGSVQPGFARVPAGEDATPLRVPTTPDEWSVPCADYTAHQLTHRQTPSGWTCDTCHPEGEGA